MNSSPFSHALARLQEFPRLSYGHYPTPIEELPRLRTAITDDLGTCPRLFIKRDDYTGAGLGGNKVRKLEYVLAQAQTDGTNVVITCGGVKSNHARVTAALCARLGLRCILVLNNAAVSYQDWKPASFSLDELYGAEIIRVANRDERRTTVDAIAAELRAAGKNVTVIPLGASIPLGALGFVRAAQEAKAQLDTLGVSLDYLFHCTSSGGTQAGLVAGNQLFSVAKQIIGVSPDDPSASISAEVAQITRGVGELLGVSLTETVTVLDEYTGAGYGIPSPAGEQATALLARTEGIVLDPVYTAKAMAGLLDWIRQGKLTAQDNVLFWHTGGQLALFYAPEDKAI